MSAQVEEGHKDFVALCRQLIRLLLGHTLANRISLVLFTAANICGVNTKHGAVALLLV